MIVLKIDVTKIDKSALFKGTKGTYLDAVLHENKDGTDQYGNDGFVTQGVSKERREAGERGPIIGNYRNVGAKAPAKPAAKPQADHEWDGDDSSVPF